MEKVKEYISKNKCKFDKSKTVCNKYTLFVWMEL